MSRQRIELEAMDWGQVIESLQAREESWRNTAAYLQDGEFPNNTLVCEECSNAEEARKIADYYKRIVTELERQRDAQENDHKSGK